LVAFQITDGQEQGLYEIRNEGAPVILKSDNTSNVYFACGNKIAKLSMPEFGECFDVYTEHTSAIIEFTVSPQTFVTTSLDGSMKVHSVMQGEQIMNSMDDINCDHLEACDDYILTRSMDGMFIHIWRYHQNEIDLDL
jgi:hypothetical protein